MTKTPPPRQFSDDQPKTNPWSEDRLGHRPFAERIASTIVNLDARNGYIIGLQGAWGSGKSTVLNFVQAFISKHNEELTPEAERLSVINFRPWMISGHQDLISAFFKVLKEALDDNAAKGAKRWKRIVGAARAGSDPLIDAVATVGLVVDPSGGVASKVAAAIGKRSLADVIDHWSEEPSLQAAYETLRTQLDVKAKRFLVVIDDIDRLDSTEIRSIMQMVKTVGRLPNTIYLLAYDRKIVWSALDKYVPQAKGQPGFAEKIVQHELDLPQPTRNDLLRILDSEIRFMMEQSSPSLRWSRLAQSGMRQWIRYPRDVFRLSNSARFAWPALENEIDPQDLLCMEGLRLFDEPVFNWIRQNRDFLLQQGSFRMALSERETAVGEELRDALPVETRQDTLEVLCALFPTRAKIIRGKQTFESESYGETVKRRGIASHAGYDAYFSLFPSPNAVPKTVIDKAINELDNQAAQLAILRIYLDKRDETGTPLIANYLEELECRFQGHGASQPTEAFLYALFEVGEDILRIEWDEDLFFEPLPAQTFRLIIGMLTTWGPERAGVAIRTAFEKSKSPAFCASVWLAIGRDLGEIPSEGTQRINPCLSGWLPFCSSSLALPLITIPL